MQLTLIRHGETHWNELGKVQGQADIELLPSGIEQAAQLSQKMNSQLSSYAMIYSSEMKRALITAEKIRNEHKIEIKTDPRLNSRNLGTFSGMTLVEIADQYPEEYKKWISGDITFCPPNGESSLQMLDKIREFIKMLQQTHQPSDKIMIITHRENLGVFLFLINKERSNDPLHSIQNCTPYDIQLPKNFEM